MKRTQIYIDDSDFEMLNKIGKQERKSVSELIRKAIKNTYKKKEEGLKVLKEAAGLWQDRDFDTQEYVRSLREDSRNYKV